jgi:hypothetical protein
MQRRTPHLLEPKRSILAGLVKFLAVGCGLNEVSPPANIESNILADSMATYLKPHPSSLLSRLRRLMSRTQEAEAQVVAPKARGAPIPIR